MDDELKIKEFVKYIIDKHILLTVNTAEIWINSDEMSDIIKLIFFLFYEPLTKIKNINFQHNLNLQLDHLTEMVRIDLSELPLEVIGTTKEALTKLLNEYDEIAHTN